ncbi:transcriptional regulator [Marmoricola endophyticus]|uniref:Transcriptional regulator n=1 Tax=Marmoricola endophyticus TaxID=2040280 RepID=A0A917F194_9ACTN|nr:DJ-1/PfpI family protein [Marmoricola endophyticus]GGF32746.1 transcriptional regulator [Marmoricola endophyticus]
MHHVVVLALPGVVAFDLAVPAQVFGHPDQAGDYRLSVCGTEAGEVRTTTGFSVLLDRGVDAVADADTVVVPGYAPLDEPPPVVLEALRRAHRSGARTVSVCTGAFALAAAGILDGRRATTHWRDAPELARRCPGAEVDPDVLWVEDGRVLTSAGVAAGIDLCLHLVRHDLGERVATEVARRMVVAPHRTETQAQYLHRPVPAGGDGLGPTYRWAEEHLAEPLSVTDLAAHAGWAPRTFARRFVAETGTTPGRWLGRRRVAFARHLLETTDLGVEQVAARSGLGSAANLRARLQEDTGTSPSAYRRAYRGTR